METHEWGANNACTQQPMELVVIIHETDATQWDVKKGQEAKSKQGSSHLLRNRAPKTDVS